MSIFLNRILRGRGVLFLVGVSASLIFQTCGQTQRAPEFKLGIETGAPDQIFLGQSIDLLLDSGIIKEQEYSDDYVWYADGDGPLRHAIVREAEEGDYVESVGLVFGLARDCAESEKIARQLIERLVTSHGDDFQILENKIETKQDSIFMSIKPRVTWLLPSGEFLQLVYSPCRVADSLQLKEMLAFTQVLLYYGYLEEGPDVFLEKYRIAKHLSRSELGFQD